MSAIRSRRETYRYLWFRLRPGAGPEYDRRHRRITDDLLTELRAAGITQNSIYRSGELVVVTIGHPTDVERAYETVAASSAARAWGKRFADLLIGEPQPLEEVWNLESEAERR